MSLCGAQVPSTIPPDELRELLDCGAKLVRVFIAWAGPIEVLNAWSLYQWRTHLVEEHTRIITANLLPVFAEYPDSRFVLNLLHPCGGFDSDGRAKCFGSAPSYQWDIFDAWNIALRPLWEHPQCICADLLNEPAGMPSDVNPFYLNCANYVSTSKRIAISPIYGNPGYMRGIQRPPGRTVWYEPHIYQPMSFTHQGIDGRPLMRWSRDVERELLATIDVIRKWQRQNKAIIYVGEFGVSTFAVEKDRAKYYDAVMDACEKYGWHATAHCWGRSANVWDISTREVLRVLKEYWA